MQLLLMTLVILVLRPEVQKETCMLNLMVIQNNKERFLVIHKFKIYLKLLATPK